MHLPSGSEGIWTTSERAVGYYKETIAPVPSFAPFKAESAAAAVRQIGPGRFMLQDTKSGGEKFRRRSWGLGPGPKPLPAAPGLRSHNRLGSKTDAEGRAGPCGQAPREA